jgi:hypothetical protein
VRAFTHGHTRQLAAVARQFLIDLAARTPILAGAAEVTYVDIDSLLRRVYGKRKQGASFGHTKVGGYSVRLRGLSPLVATISTPIAAPVIGAMRLRKGSAGSSRGAASLLTEALSPPHTGLTKKAVTPPSWVNQQVQHACPQNQDPQQTRSKLKINTTIDRWIEAKCIRK